MVIFLYSSEPSLSKNSPLLPDWTFVIHLASKAIFPQCFKTIPQSWLKGIWPVGPIYSFPLRLLAFTTIPGGFSQTLNKEYQHSQATLWGKSWAWITSVLWDSSLWDDRKPAHESSQPPPQGKPTTAPIIPSVKGNREVSQDGVDTWRTPKAVNDHPWTSQVLGSSLFPLQLGSPLRQCHRCWEHLSATQVDFVLITSMC
jgi:hypothetical protein